LGQGSQLSTIDEGLQDVLLALTPVV
jgi:hypothetical protein